uniref:PAS domain-containing protein n=3 Tax=Hydrogenophaga sp. TaxID=1904254 RepID=UPI0040360E97
MRNATDAMTTTHTDSNTPAAAPDGWWQQLPGMVLVIRREGEQVYASSPLQACAPEWSRQPVLANLTPEVRRQLDEHLQSEADFQINLEWSDAAEQGLGERVLSCAAKWMPGPCAYLCLLVDISGPHQEERNARSRQHFLRHFCNALPIMLAYYDLELHCQYANRHYAELYGFSETSILGKSVREVLGEVDLDVRPLREQAFRENRAIHFEREFVRPEGTSRLRSIIQPLLDDRGHRVAGAAMNQVVTAQHLAEKALEASEARLSRFVEACNEGVLFHADGVITDVNPAACRLYGANLQQLLGHSILEFIAPEQIEAARRTIERAVDSRLESTIITTHGERIAVEVTGRTMLRNGERLRMVVLRDIRDRLQAQARIDELIAGL